MIIVRILEKFLCWKSLRHSCKTLFLRNMTSISTLYCNMLRMHTHCTTVILRLFVAWQHVTVSSFLKCRGTWRARPWECAEGTSTIISFVCAERLFAYMHRRFSCQPSDKRLCLLSYHHILFPCFRVRPDTTVSDTTVSACYLTLLHITHIPVTQSSKLSQPFNIFLTKPSRPGNAKPPGWKPGDPSPDAAAST